MESLQQIWKAYTPSQIWKAYNNAIIKSSEISPLSVRPLAVVEIVPRLLRSLWSKACVQGAMVPSGLGSHRLSAATSLRAGFNRRLRA